MSVSRQDIINQSLDNLKKRMKTSPITVTMVSKELEDLEEAINLLVEENNMLRVGWVRLTSSIKSFKNKLTSVPKELVYAVDAIITMSGMKVEDESPVGTHQGKWIIVKNANYSSWRKHFLYNPENGVDESLSCFRNVVSKRVGIKAYYTDMNKGLMDLHKLSKADPFGNYALCPMLEKPKKR